jgi:hypothetical protein
MASSGQYRILTGAGFQANPTFNLTVNSALPVMWAFAAPPDFAPRQLARKELVEQLDALRPSRREVLQNRMPPRAAIQVIIDRSRPVSDQWLDDEHD